MAISAVTGDTLREAGTIGIDGLANLVPSLATVSNNQPLAQSYRIRGLGTDPNIPTFEPSVALFIDGVYLPRTGLGVEDLVDINRIEVLKGPQSTLYGKNATAGVISVVSARPSAPMADEGPHPPADAIRTARLGQQRPAGAQLDEPALAVELKTHELERLS